MILFHHIATNGTYVDMFKEGILLFLVKGSVFLSYCIKWPEAKKIIYRIKDNISTME
jgi:hypothetical protein